MPEKGIVSFIKTKLEHAIPPKEIRRMLLAADFDQDKIDAAFEHVKRAFPDTHQDLAAVNDFMPVLRDKKAASASGTARQRGEKFSSAAQLGLFRGRLRRKDFILGFLFFFAIGYVALAFCAFFIAFLFPSLWQSIMLTIQNDREGLLVMMLPVLLLPITIMMISLITRRLHNLGLPGGLALLYLLMFVPPYAGTLGFCVTALDLSLVILFVVLLAMKGDPAPNAHGALPASKGSFFRRIFNQ